MKTLLKVGCIQDFKVALTDGGFDTESKVRLQISEMDAGGERTRFMFDMTALTDKYLVWFHMHRIEYDQKKGMNIRDDFRPALNQLSDYVSDDMESSGFTVAYGLFGTGNERPLEGEVEFLEWNTKKFEYVEKE